MHGGNDMRRKPLRLPSRLPAGSKYVLESRGKMKGAMLVHRYVELPDGRRIELTARMVPTCNDSSKGPLSREQVKALTT